MDIKDQVIIVIIFIYKFVQVCLHVAGHLKLRYDKASNQLRVDRMSYGGHFLIE